MNDLFTASLDAFRRARRDDPATSHVAAERVTFAGEHYQAIVRSLFDGPATIYELAARTGLSHVQVARRMPELEKEGSVEPTGETAPSPSGRPCRAWRRR